MSDNNNGDYQCCKIPVCLEFVSVSATDEFKQQMKSLFQEIFAELCGNDGDNGDN